METCRSVQTVNNREMYALARQLRAEMREMIREELATLVKLQPYTRSTADGTGDKVQGYQTEGSDEQPYDFDGRRVFPFGLRSVPPKGVLAAWLGLGGESGNGIIVGAESSRFGPSNLNDGEVALYNKENGTIVRLGADGSVTISDKGGAQLTLDGSGNITAQAATGGSVQISSDPTGAVKLGPVGTLAVLVQGTVDSFGIPVTQNPAASATIVKAG